MVLTIVGSYNSYQLNILLLHTFGDIFSFTSESPVKDHETLNFSNT
jgi:hypothetical protein